MGSEEAVYNAFNTLSNGGVVIQPIHEEPWSKCCATVIDKFGFVGGFLFDNKASRIRDTLPSRLTVFLFHCLS